jgi:DNA polymerase-3 subunit gamma/tau
VLPKIKLNRSVKKSKTISISAAFNQINEKEKAADERDSSIVKKELFSEKKMQEVWKEVIALVKRKGKSNLAITLGVHLPILNDNFEIELPLSNSSQVELIEEEKYIVLDYLRKSLYNDYITLSTKVIEGEKRNIPYTNKDKFKKMLNENPHLETLRVQLGLDPDY